MSVVKVLLWDVDDECLILTCVMPSWELLDTVTLLKAIGSKAVRCFVGGRVGRNIGTHGMRTRYRQVHLSWG